MNTHNKPVTVGTTEEQDDRAMRGAALREVMESALSARQMSVSGLARDASVQRGDIYRWWRGESRPTRNSLARIAAALGMDIDPLRQALGDPPRDTERPDAVLAAISALSERLGRLEAAQHLGFENVLTGLLAIVESMPDAPLTSGVREGLRRDQSRQQTEDPDTPSPSPERQPRGTGAGRG